MFSPPKKTTRSWTKSKTFSDLFSHLEIYLNKYLNWKHQINYIIINLIEANAMLSKIRRYVGIKTLKSIYYAIFESKAQTGPFFKISKVQWQCCTWELYIN